MYLSVFHIRRTRRGLYLISKSGTDWEGFKMVHYVPPGVHGVRVGHLDSGPLCLCGQWGCPYALGDLEPPRRWWPAIRTGLAVLVAVLGVVALWLLIAAVAVAMIKLWVVLT